MRGHLKKEGWHNKKNVEKTFESSTSQGYVTSTSDNVEILYSKATISFKGGKQLNNLWIMGSGMT